MKLPASSIIAWAERYEGLRREALAPRSGSIELPMAVAWLIRHGVAEWIYRYALGEPDSAKFPERPAAAVAKVESPNAVIQIIAQMILPHLEGPHRR